MASEEEKKQFLNDQIKGMLGPCMITFAIPLTIPGLTLTLVVLSGDTTFPKYGALHIIGLLFLAVSILLLLLGCIFRFMWKPRMDPEVLQHLTPANSMRLRNNRRDIELGQRERKLNDVYRGNDKNNKTYSPRPINNSSEIIQKETNSNEIVAHLQNGQYHNNVNQNTNISLTENRLQQLELATASELASKVDVGSDEGNESEARPRDTFYNRQKSSSRPLNSPRHSRHLAPLIANDEQGNTQHLPDSPQGKQPSYDEIQKWRRKKKRKTKQRSGTGFGVDNYGSECDEENSDNTEPSNVARKKDDGSESESRDDNLTRTKQTTEGNMLQYREPSVEKKRKKKKKKYLKTKPENSDLIATEDVDKTNYKDVSDIADSKPTYSDTVEPAEKSSKPQVSLFKNADDNDDDSDGSVGSADSVLAQYTSRSHRDEHA